MIDFNYMYINCKASFGCDFKLDRSQVYQDAKPFEVLEQYQEVLSF